LAERLDPNLERLEAAVERLGPLADQLVLVGGCATGLLVTDGGAAPIRPTIDVDLVLDVIAYAEFTAFETRLRERGFGQRADDDEPICRWWSDAVCVDVMPVGGFLGFTNPWYAEAVETAVDVTLPSGARVRHVDAPHFLACKLAAFEDRGADDPVTSHDAEDVVLVVDGRPEIVDEVAGASAELRAAVARGVGAMLGDGLFMDALEGYFDRPIAAARARIVRERMGALAGVC
jgi:predicted nucleotidyltransferase